MDKTALYPLSYGLYVIGVKNDFCEFGGCVVDALMQISSGNTPQIAVSCMKNNNTPTMIEKYGKFTVSVLGRAVDPFVLSCFGFQSGKNSDKWAAVEHDFADGLPVLKKAVSYLACTVSKVIEADTHILFIADVTDAFNGENDEPLLYADYHKEYKDKALSAYKLHYSEGSNQETVPAAASGGEKWVCPVCGYVYDGEIPFEELPDDWKCPLCGVEKSRFTKK